MPIGAALRLVGSRGTLTLTSQKPIVTIESYRPQTIRQYLSWVNRVVWSRTADFRSTPDIVAKVFFGVTNENF